MPLGLGPGKARMPGKREPGNLPRVVTVRMRAASGAVVFAVVTNKSSLAETGRKKADSLQHNGFKRGGDNDRC